MRRLPALVAALLLPATPPLLLGTAALTGALLVSQAPAQAQSGEAVAKVAQAITVRIEGATQGSGVLVKRDGNRYTVLTAWHVVSGQSKGEELDIYTPDGQRHQLEQGSIKRLGEVDMAVLTFTSSISYEVAQSGDVKSVSMGSPVFVAGFPLPSSAVPTRLLRFLKGDVIANATVVIPNGYQLLYSNPALPGMSGGAVLNAQGQLIGIHGQGETDAKMSEQEGVAVKTGTNQAVPIAYYSQYSSGAAVIASTAQAETADDYLAQAKALLGKKGSEQEVIRLAGQALAIKQSADAFFYRAYAKNDLGDFESSILDSSNGLLIARDRTMHYVLRANSKMRLGDTQGAISDYSQAIALSPSRGDAFSGRGNARLRIGDTEAARNDLAESIRLLHSPQGMDEFGNRANSRQLLGDLRGALADYNEIIRLYPESGTSYMNRAAVWQKLGNSIQMCSDLLSLVRMKYPRADYYYGSNCSR